VQLSKKAKETPFELEGLQEQTKRLLAYNVKMQDIIPTIDML
jgi:hypothetical protein